MAKAPLRLKRRADFLRARQGKQAHARAFILQGIRRPAAPHEAELALQPRFGFTVSKRCGGAVGRNRIRRRLKEALRLLSPLPARGGCDYVIVARPEARSMSFCALQSELARALGKVTCSDKAATNREGRAASGTENPQPRSSKGRTSRR